MHMMSLVLKLSCSCYQCGFHAWHSHTDAACCLRAILYAGQLSPPIAIQLITRPDITNMLPSSFAQGTHWCASFAAHALYMMCINHNNPDYAAAEAHDFTGQAGLCSVSCCAVFICQCLSHRCCSAFNQTLMLAYMLLPICIMHLPGSVMMGFQPSGKPF